MANYPSGLLRRYRWHFDHPWRLRARSHLGFKRWLRRHGYLSPHFTQAEAACKDGTLIPKGRMRRRAQRHAFRLEKLRHRLGDRSLSPLSWYRTPEHNRRVGGALRSRHLRGDATDFTSLQVERVGRDKFNAAAESIFRFRGFGRYPSGSVHVDSRPYRARW